VDALMRIIENPGHIASGKIYNIGNPKNNLSIKQLAKLMIETALAYPEYRERAKKVRLIVTTSEKYYGRGYQDIQNRVPKIDTTRRDLEWKPRIAMRDALKRIYDAYRGHISDARRLVT
jgi:nucleoside-diphosphate-sugar epimerase